jgi:nitrilase
MPLLRLAIYALGVQLFCARTADDRDSWLPSMRHIAMEGRCFVLSACQYLLRKDLPDNVRASPGDSPEAVLMRGGSVIVDPLGNVLAGPDFTGETILAATLDMNDVVKGKFDFDAVGHYSRPDVFRLTVNEAPMKAVSAADNSDVFPALEP